MKSIFFAAALLLTGPRIAANDTPYAPKGLNPPSRSEAMDALSLTELDQQMAWNDLRSQATEQATPEGFQAVRGSVLPQRIITNPMPVNTANKVPDLRPYHYALLSNHELLIVNPLTGRSSASFGSSKWRESKGLSGRSTGIIAQVRNYSFGSQFPQRLSVDR